MYVYMHWLCWCKNSSKWKYICLSAKWLGESSARFSFRGNWESISDDFWFESMDLETMSCDIKTIFDSMKEKWVVSFTPVASSLWASSLLFFLKKNPRYIDMIDKILLLAPSLDFAKNKQRIRKQDWDSVSQEKRMNQGYREKYHYSNKTTERLSYSLFHQSLEADLIGFLKTIDTSIIIVAGRNDDIISYDDIVEISSKKENITLLSVDDGHRLKESMDVILSALVM